MFANILKVGKNMLTPLELVTSLPELIRAGRADSLVEYTADTRVEPICLIDAALIGQAYLDDALQCELSTFAGFYLQAVQQGQTMIDGVNVMERLAPYNPRRDPINAAADTIASIAGVLSTEDFKFGMPKISMEAPEQRPRLEQTFNKDTLATIRDKGNLSVGKRLDVTVRVNESVVTVPVLVRLQTIPVTGNAIEAIICGTSEVMNPNAKERRYMLKADQIRGMQDFIACNDIVKEHQRNILTDPTGLYLRAIEDARRNTLSGFLSGRPSVAKASQIINITEETAVNIERRLGIDLAKPASRQKLFDRTSVMVLHVFDRDRERVTIYYRGIPEYSRLSFKDLENKGKGDGPDIARLIKDFTEMKAPSF